MLAYDQLIQSDCGIKSYCALSIDCAGLSVRHRVHRVGTHSMAEDAVHCQKCMAAIRLVRQVQAVPKRVLCALAVEDRQSDKLN